ncbi:MAG: TRAP transporter small permease [Gammaproteobacteria bacterium]|nr:MAG: TRAP transporter small permease [Gammaproteobacteria bacterium]RTZ60538.1 MAG: TRAP transporter small permease [Gammaproteobacteria bacterium]
MISTALQVLRRLEDSLLVASLLLVIGVAVLQIFLRIFFDTGVVWADSFLRISVLWLAMIGGMHAARGDHHLNIDLGQRLLSDSNRRRVRSFIYLCTALICAVVAWYSLNLVQMEYEDGEMAFAAVPVWLAQSILPIGFAVIALRYLIAAFPASPTTNRAPK